MYVCLPFHQNQTWEIMQLSCVLSNTSAKLEKKWDRAAHMFVTKAWGQRWSAPLACPHPLDKEHPGALLRSRIERKFLLWTTVRVKIDFFCFQNCNQGEKKNNRKREGENQKHVSDLQTKRNAYSLYNGVYRNSQQHGSEDFCKNVTTPNTCLLFGQRLQRLFMMAEVIHGFIKKVADKAEIPASL